MCVLSKKENNLREKEKALVNRENSIAEKEKLAEDFLQRLAHQEVSLKKREALLLEVEECVTVCYMAFEECIKKEIQKGLEVNIGNHL